MNLLYHPVKLGPVKSRTTFQANLYGPLSGMFENTLLHSFSHHSEYRPRFSVSTRSLQIATNGGVFEVFLVLLHCSTVLASDGFVVFLCSSVRASLWSTFQLGGVWDWRHLSVYETPFGILDLWLFESCSPSICWKITSISCCSGLMSHAKFSLLSFLLAVCQCLHGLLFWKLAIRPTYHTWRWNKQWDGSFKSCSTFKVAIPVVLESGPEVFQNEVTDCIRRGFSQNRRAWEKYLPYWYYQTKYSRFRIKPSNRSIPTH